jgi:uncharacterized protein
MLQDDAIEDLIARWEKRIERLETQPCSPADRARTMIAIRTYNIAIDELRAVVAARTHGGDP